MASIVGPATFPQCLVAQHHHAHIDAAKPIDPPKIYLDKSLRIVQYQLNRLDNARLLLVERATDNPQYAPVYKAILSRSGMSRQHREEALQGLVELGHSSVVTELMVALELIDGADRQQQRTGRQLSAMLLTQPVGLLKDQLETLHAAIESKNSLVRSIGYAGLITAGQSEAAWSRAMTDPSGLLDWLASVALVRRPALRSALRNSIVGLLGDRHPDDIRRAAIDAIAFIPSAGKDTFQLVAPFVSESQFRTSAVRTLLGIPPQDRDAKTCAQLAGLLVKHAEATPAAERTNDQFIDAMQLADQLLARIPADLARAYRDRLREMTVRVVRIQTVEEEMRYDTAYFVVEAGRPVQVILKNVDLMPHNFVVTVPGVLQEVAELGALAGPNNGYQGKQYVPESEKVLFATHMVAPDKQARLTFTAPSEPGEYPYVCTFPRHWMRMYGVMVVVEDLDAWLQNPSEPKDPIGNNRSFVRSWSVDDFTEELDAGMRGRSPEIGQRIFTEATCALCHKISGQGGAVGPDLTDVFPRWKQDRIVVLGEILDPSHRIDAKYAVQLVVTVDGNVISGILSSEDKATVSILTNPESPAATVVKRADIEEMVKTSTSMMPKALLDRFTMDEIFELLAYLEFVGGTLASPGR